MPPDRKAILLNEMCCICGAAACLHSALFLVCGPFFGADTEHSASVVYKHGLVLLEPLLPCQGAALVGAAETQQGG